MRKKKCYFSGIRDQIGLRRHKSDWKKTLEKNAGRNFATRPGRTSGLSLLPLGESYK